MVAGWVGNMILEQLLQHPIIPVIEIDSAADAVPMAEAVVAGGINVLEVVLRTPEAIESIAAIGRHLPEVLLGAGTVIRREQAEQVIDAGAQFGVSPGLNPSIHQYLADAGLPFIPGVMTPTEIESALQHNCSFLKFFPAQAAGGVSFLRSIAGPYQSTGIRFCATGGISLDNMNDYLALPMISSIGGSWLASRELINNKQWAQITRNVENALKLIDAEETS